MSQEPQGWGPGRHIAPAAPRRNSGVVIALVILAIAVVGGAAVVLLNKDDDSSADPEQTMRAYFDAFADSDCAAMADYASAESLRAGGLTVEAATRACEDSLSNEAIDFTVDEIEPVSEEGDTAILEVTITNNGEQQTKDVTLVKQDDEWKIDLRTMEGE